MMFHPADTNQYIQRDRIDNFALRYTHFLDAERDSGKYKFKLPKKIIMSQAGQEIIRKILERQECQLKSLSRIYHFRAIEATVDWRLIVGLGGGHVQETSMTLHHVYGIPYIPGSAVKGVLRHWTKDEGQSDSAEKIFGKQDNKGDVIFMDAFPVNNVTFAADIMNPHYPDYYGNGGKYPTDCQNPKPVNFLTVKKTTFRFAFMAKNSDDLNKVAEWIKDSFKHKGFGAKTAVGYGYFDNVQDITKRLKEKSGCGR